VKRTEASEQGPNCGLRSSIRHRLRRVLRFFGAFALILVIAIALWPALPAVFQILAIVFVGVLQFALIFWFMGKGGVQVYNPGEIETRFDDVWGQDHVVEKVRENIIFLQQPDAIEKAGGYVPGGILLWGPPGTGKTLMAEAVAGETGKPYVFVDPGAFQSMFVGVGILKVRALFRKLRKLAVRHGGVVVFFDEADSLGNRGALSESTNGTAAAMDACHGLSFMGQPSQSMMSHNQLYGDANHGVKDRMVTGFGGDGGTLQALLSELSGLKKPHGFWNRWVRQAFGFPPKQPPKYRILVMMATNMMGVLDEALLRPGRIDRTYKVGYPSKAGRVRIYEGYLAKVNHNLTAQQIDKLATITPYATGASIKDLVNEALINSLRESRDVVTWQDVTRARHLKSLGPSEGVEYIERERHATAIHEACHAVVAYFRRSHLAIDIATIEKGASYLGMVSSIPPEDQFTNWRSEFEADLAVSLASLAGERIFFNGDHSSGVMGDLNMATRLAAYMEGYWGMGSSIASHGVLKDLGIGPADSEGASVALSLRVEAKLAEILTQVERLIRDNRRSVLAVAHALETYRTIGGDDVEAVIEGGQGPLVDGGYYMTDEFMAEAEVYHQLAVEAHVAHASVDVPLPVAP
jgi:cell division protease FtsH